MTRIAAVSTALLSGLAMALLICAYNGVVLYPAVRAMSDGAQSQAIGSLLIAAGAAMTAGMVLLLGATAWSARSAISGVSYVVIGSFLAALPLLTSILASTSATQPSRVLPDALASALGLMAVYATGPTSAGIYLGAGMAVAGLVGVVRACFLEQPGDTADERRLSSQEVAELNE